MIAACRYATRDGHRPRHPACDPGAAGDTPPGAAPNLHFSEARRTLCVHPARRSKQPMASRSVLTRPRRVASW
jgi:hypothetical protein